MGGLNILNIRAMTSLFVGIFSGLLIILLIGILKNLEKKVVYGLILSGIGFLYVGFTWSNTRVLILNAIQSVFFLFLAYYGIKKSLSSLATGYLLHGTWDIAYSLIFPNSDLIPPHYDLFCLSIDFTIGIYLFVIKYQESKKLVAGMPGINKQR